MKRVLAAAFLALSIATTTSAAWASPSASPLSHIARPNAVSAGRVARPSASIGVLVRFKQPSSAPLVVQLLSGIDGSGATPADRSRGLYTFRTPKTQTDQQYAIHLMLEAPGIAYAEPNYVRYPTAYTPPTDPAFSDTTTWTADSDYYPSAKHWWLGAMNAPGAWAIGQGDTYPTHGIADDIKIAVIDSGFYLNHPDLAGGTVVAGKDYFPWYNPDTGVFGTPDSNVTPDANSDVEFASHGTAVAAAAGGAVNGVGMVGVGWNPKIVGYKVAGPITAAWDPDPAGTVMILDSRVALAIHDAVDSGCKVINISISGPSYSATLEEAITYAHDHGVVVVCAVGNEGDTTVNYPAACTYSVGIGGTALSGTSSIPTRADFSDYAPGVVDLVAPGETFWSATQPGYDAGYGSPDYQFWSGTSFSAPAAAGAIAYLWRAMPDLTGDQIVTRVENSATDMGAPGRDDYFGYGLVNMQAAYNQLIADYPMLATPSITASAYMRNGQSVSWSTASGYNVSYAVRVDGALRSTQSATSYALASLADGQHTISIQPTSTRNWNTTSTAQTTLTVDATAPLPSGFAIHGTTISWSVAESSPYTVQAYVDTATPAAAVGNSLDAPGLADGLHTLHVDATDAAGNSSGWVTWDFALGSLPVVPSVVVTDAVSAIVTWAPVSGAASYDYRVNAGSVVNTSSTAVALSGLTSGVTTVTVRTVFGPSVFSDWATATVTDVAVVPGTPSPSSPATVGAPSVGVSWLTAPDALSYEYRLNGGSATATTALSVTITGLLPGPNEVAVRSLNNLRQSAWATATVTNLQPGTPTLTLAPSSARVTYPATTLTLTGSINAPSQLVRLESSTDGANWADTGLSWTSTAAPMPVALEVGVSRSAYYRLVFDGTALWNATVSPIVSAVYVPRVDTPKAPSRVKLNRRFTVSDAVNAPAANGPSRVTFQFRRYQKVHGRYTWVLRKSVRVKGSVSSSTSMTFKTSLKLTYTGKWRVVAAYSGASMYADTASSYRAFTAR